MLAFLACYLPWCFISLSNRLLSFFVWVEQSYKLLARNTADFLIPMMTAVEWATWKQQLNQVKYDKALFD